MAKYQYVKKKLNVPLLIVLLCCAFVPGIIYLIWVNIPRKVLLDAPKSNGWILRLVGTAIIPLNWLVWKLMLDADDFPMIFYLGLALGVAALIPAIFSKKSSSGLAVGLTLFFSVCALGFAISMVYYGWPSLIGSIVALVGCSNGFKYARYLASQEQAAQAEPQEAQATEEQAE